MPDVAIGAVVLPNGIEVEEEMESDEPAAEASEPPEVTDDRSSSSVGRLGEAVLVPPREVDEVLVVVGAVAGAAGPAEKKYTSPKVGPTLKIAQQTASAPVLQVRKLISQRKPLRTLVRQRRRR